MAKQLNRVKERYVPQQESYRNLPGLRSQAEPVRTVATPVEADGNAQRLKQLAEAFSSGNKALTDYFRMEKSFEETNRATNRARAMAGLPPVEGKGNLEYGSQWGYQEGLGMADGARLKQKFELEVIQQDFFVDMENPDPEAAGRKLNEFAMQFYKDNLDGQSDAYVMGASQDLAKIRVEMTSKAMDAAVNVRKHLNAANADAFVKARFIEAAPADSRGIRQFISDIRKNADKFNMTPLAMNGLAIESVQSAVLEAYNTAHDSKDYRNMNAAVDKLQDLRRALVLPDESGGVSLMGDFSEDGSLRTSPLKDYLKETNALVKKLWTESQALQEDARKVDMSNLQASYVDRVRREKLTPEQMLDELSTKFNAGYLTGTEFQDMTKVALTMTSPDWALTEDPKFVERVFKDTTLSLTRLNQLRSQRLISKGTYTEKASMITKARAESDRWRSQEAHRSSLKDKTVRDQLDQTRATNEQLKYSLFDDMGITNRQDILQFDSYMKCQSPEAILNEDASRRKLESIVSLREAAEAREAAAKVKAPRDTSGVDAALGILPPTPLEKKGIMSSAMKDKTPAQKARMTTALADHESLYNSRLIRLESNESQMDIDEVAFMKQKLEAEYILNHPADLPQASLDAALRKRKNAVEALAVIARDKP